jgi:Domain of unknown function (DUF1772)
MSALVGWGVVLMLMAVVTSGLIADQMLAIGLANLANRRQPETEWTRRFQFENALFTRTMPIAIMAPLLASVICCFLADGSGRALFIAATAMMSVVLVITLAVNVPINNQIAAWQVGAAPVTWTHVRDRWLTFHWARTAIGIVSFVLAVAGLRVV